MTTPINYFTCVGHWKTSRYDGHTQAMILLNWLFEDDYFFQLLAREIADIIVYNNDRSLALAWYIVVPCLVEYENKIEQLSLNEIREKHTALLTILSSRIPHLCGVVRRQNVTQVGYEFSSRLLVSAADCLLSLCGAIFSFATCFFPAYDAVASALIQNLLEDPQTQQNARELDIRRYLSVNRASRRIIPQTFLTRLAPMVSRDSVVFIEAANCQDISRGGILHHVLHWVVTSSVRKPSRADARRNKLSEKVCMDLKIKSQNDKDKLLENELLTDLKVFTEGTMLAGDFTCKKVQDVKPLLKTKLIESGKAIIYVKPEQWVMSRSGDECVVTLTDQWYITSGESKWNKLAEECLSNMNLYSDKTRHGFEHILSWFYQWAYSRPFALGTRIPWDEHFLVDPPSISTLYMAYYTVVHLLHERDMYVGCVSSVLSEQLTDEGWDYIIYDNPVPAASKIPHSLLHKMQRTLCSIDYMSFPMIDSLLTELIWIHGTTVIVAHRLGTIKNVDGIALNGIIVQYLILGVLNSRLNYFQPR